MNISIPQTSYFFIMLFIGWFIYLLLDLGMVNKATPNMKLGETIRIYFKVNIFEIVASILILFACALLYKFEQLQGFLAMLGLQFTSNNEAPLGFALILGMNIKVITLFFRKIKNPIKVDENNLKNMINVVTPKP